MISNKTKVNNSKCYEFSNSLTGIKYARLNKAVYQALLTSDEKASTRLIKGQAVLDYLCDKFSIPRIQLVVSNTPRPHSKTSQCYGLYKYRHLALSENVEGICICVYNLSAKKRQPIAIKTFVNTLIHEFCHHYDYYYLGMANSLHTKGFYMRISDIEKKFS